MRTVVVTGSGSGFCKTDRPEISVLQSTRQVNDLPLTGSTGTQLSKLDGTGAWSSPAGRTEFKPLAVRSGRFRSMSTESRGLQNNTRIDGAGRDISVATYQHRVCPDS